MSDTVLSIIAFVLSGASFVLNGYTIAVSRQSAKRLKRLRDGGKP